MEGSLPHGRHGPLSHSRLATADHAGFIAANTSLQTPPLVPEIRLRIAGEAHDLWRRTEEELEAIGLMPPPFWAFAWAGGQGVARYVLDHPDLVRGKTVLDFATGSGLVAIAAALAGAGTVLAADIDPFCATAVRLNAEANGVAIAFRGTDPVGTDDGWDVVLAGDIFYDRGFCDHFLPWLRGLAARGATVIAGDPGRAYLPAGLEALATYFVPVSLAIEDDEVKRTTVWRFPDGPRR